MTDPSLQASSPGFHGRDLIAGLVVFLVALPLCLGIAHASGAPLHAGIISGIIGGLIVGALSGSHVSVSGPAAGLAAIVVAQISGLGSFEAFLTAVLISGFLQLGLAALRAGGLANYFPSSVIKGLLAAIGVLLILKQMPHLLGHDSDYEGDMSFNQEDGDNTFSALMSTFKTLVPGAAIIGIVSMSIMVVWGKTKLKKSIVPSALVAVVVGTLISEFYAMVAPSWALETSHLVQVPVVGSEGSLADLLHFPDMSRFFDPAIWVAAITLAIVASLETLLNLEATDRIDPLRRSSPPNRELMAQGVGNIVAGAIGGLPMTSVIVRSSVNAGLGVRSRLSTLTHGALLLVSVAFFATILNRVPLAALAAVLVVTGFKLANPRLLKQMWNDGISQFVPFLVTVVAIVWTDLLVGVMIGLGVSLAFALWRYMKGGFHVIEEEHASGKVTRIELTKQVNFFNRAHLAMMLDEFERDRHVIIDARVCEYIDPDVLALIQEFVTDTSRARGVTVSLVGFQEQYELGDVVEHIDYSTREIQTKMTPDAVLRILRDGNDRFATNRRLKRDLVRQADKTAAGQHPMACVLSCIDSRAPVELLFDLGIGDIFSIRVAGNVPTDEVLGSMEYACKVAGSKLIVVLGHTRCGAVSATCDFAAGALDLDSLGLENLPSITNVIQEAVDLETSTTGDRTSNNSDFVGHVTQIHIENTIEYIREHSSALSGMLDRREIAIIGAIYDVKTARVTFYESAPSTIGVAGA
ncbi:MAG: bifunctional SulP family inorganic anion transporter/carbonic anhydrase [Planctomycetes bacterium]|nr:bifunctional SulP family inorganic anion transporter/carbonic anhydrase [Planctomycetota bacterium]MCB9916783.1 bifunctional SulP family inorganic anion transporter/carbonic anhydrase [Planctomycetota bacterium]